MYVFHVHIPNSGNSGKKNFLSHDYKCVRQWWWCLFPKIMGCCIIIMYVCASIGDNTKGKMDSKIYLNIMQNYIAYKRIFAV